MDKIKGLLFDLDGVLVSTEQNHFFSWKKIATILKIEFNHIDNEALKGVSRVNSLKKILAIGNVNITENEFTEFLKIKNDYYLESIQDLNASNMLPGVESLLIAAKERGIKIGLGSSSKNARLILNLLGISDFFDVIVDGSDVLQAKPNPEVFLLGAKGMNLIPSECIVFEDAKSGVQAGREGGFYVIAVGNPVLVNIADGYLNDLTEFSIDAYA